MHLLGILYYHAFTRQFYPEYKQTNIQVQLTLKVGSTEKKISQDKYRC